MAFTKCMEDNMDAATENNRYRRNEPSGVDINGIVYFRKPTSQYPNNRNEENSR